MSEQLQLIRSVPQLNQLRVVPTRDGLLVKAMINSWHSFRKSPVGFRVAFVLTDGISIVGVSTFGRPVARNEDQLTTLEHTRMALCDNAPPNSASFFMARCRSWIRQNMPEVSRLISYVPSRQYMGVTYLSDNWNIVYCDQEAWSSWTTRKRRGDNGNEYRTKFERKP